jgi:hypothetical protein
MNHFYSMYAYDRLRRPRHPLDAMANRWKLCSDEIYLDMIVLVLFSTFGGIRLARWTFNNKFHNKTY